MDNLKIAAIAHDRYYESRRITVRKNMFREKVDDLFEQKPEKRIDFINFIAEIARYVNAKKIKHYGDDKLSFTAVKEIAARLRERKDWSDKQRYAIEEAISVCKMMAAITAQINPLSEGERNKLLRVWKTAHKEDDLPKYAGAAAAYFLDLTGVRSNEAASIRVSDMDFSRSTIRYQVSKLRLNECVWREITVDDFVVTMGRIAKKRKWTYLLHEHISPRDELLKERVSKVLKNVGRTDLVPHNLRASRAARTLHKFMQEGMTEKDATKSAANVMGWHLVSTMTRNYTSRVMNADAAVEKRMRQLELITGLKRSGMGLGSARDSHEQAALGTSAPSEPAAPPTDE